MQEQQMRHIPFTSEELDTLRSAAAAMRVAAILWIAGLLVSIVSGVAQGASRGNAVAGVAGVLCGAFLQVVLTALYAVWLFRAAAALQRVVETDDADQEMVAHAAAQVRNVFLLKSVLVILMVLLCGCIGMVLAMGGTMVALSK